jgi:hypothetical protein
MRKMNILLLFFVSYCSSNVFISDISVLQRKALTLPYYNKPGIFQKRFAIFRDGFFSKYEDQISTNFLAYGLLTLSKSGSLGETYSFVYRSFRFLFYLGKAASEACDILYCTIEDSFCSFNILELGRFDRDKNYLIDLIIEDGLERNFPLVSVKPYQFSLKSK